MTWNNRIMEHMGEDGDHWFGLHEVHYVDKKIAGWTVDSMIGGYGSVDDLISSLETMLKDAKKCKEDILNYDMKPEVTREGDTL